MWPPAGPGRLRRGGAPARAPREPPLRGRSLLTGWEGLSGFDYRYPRSTVHGAVSHPFYLLEQEPLPEEQLQPGAETLKPLREGESRTASHLCSHPSPREGIQRCGLPHLEGELSTGTPRARAPPGKVLAAGGVLCTFTVLPDF